MIELTPNLDSQSEQPLYVQLYHYIKQEIKQGHLPFQTKLPSKRRLSAYLQISQNTIESAYHQLEAEGYIESIPRRGFFVRKLEEMVQVKQAQTAIEVKELPHDGEKYSYHFYHSGVDLQNFPFSIYRKLVNETLTSESKQLLLLGHPQGELSLREEIARYLYESRGVQCSPSQIIIGSGTQYLMTLLCQILKRSLFAIEDPGYHRIKMILGNLGHSLTAIPLDQHGINLSLLEKSRANIVYVSPSHQFPLGMVMPISRRNQLLNWAASDDTRYIIEDDYDSEFRYTGKPIPALYGLDTEGKVIYIGTFSKALMPSLRVSYMVLPKDLLDAYQTNYSFYNQTVSRIDQEVLRKFIAEGYWEKHLNKMRIIYRKKRDILVSSINELFPCCAKIVGQDSGLHLLLKIKNKMNEDELSQRALEAGVKVYPISAYYHNKQHIDPTPMMLLGFASLTEQEIKEAVKLLKKAWFSLDNE